MQRQKSLLCHFNFAYHPPSLCLMFCGWNALSIGGNLLINLVFFVLFFFYWKMCHHVLASDVWGFVYACRSTIWTGEILGFPEIRKGEESAHWPQTPGIPQQIQEHWWFQSRCEYKQHSYMWMWSQNNTLTP